MVGRKTATRHTDKTGSGEGKHQSKKVKTKKIGHRDQNGTALLKDYRVDLKKIITIEDHEHEVEDDESKSLKQKQIDSQGRENSL